MRIYALGGKIADLLKYVPGLAAVTNDAGGRIRVRSRASLYDSIGAALWAGGGVALGVIFHEAIPMLCSTSWRCSATPRSCCWPLLLAFVTAKWWQRWRFKVHPDGAISVAELADLLKMQVKVAILDARTADRRERTGWIPGSVWVSDVEQLALDVYEQVVVYCDCPNDATAALVAKRLHAKGVAHVRPLAGGLEAWLKNGGLIEGLA
jgi:rhodanese-related sulfurtransferase